MRIEDIAVPMPAATSTDGVFAALYNAIITMDLPPGTKLSEVEVARQFDLSRQPVRDAFFRLSQLDFLSVRPQRATRVTPISEQAVIDATFVRLALEAECLRLVCDRATPADIAMLDDNLARQAEFAATDAISQFHALDEQFHEALCRIAGHEHVWGVIRTQKAHTDRVRWLSLSQARRTEVLADHRAIRDAVAAGDLAAADARLRNHLEHILGILPGIREAHRDCFAEDALAGRAQAD
ncbi:GntR family transcriptional regulator [Palleronia abyssalis]|uniref:HTH-type transcriptional repressor RspR n=1 Tax=Palleronia abyssalis TaxID=1501240 RepID=A0A2R8C1C8_9RHOB|nr:GntR family transcriptional regulator [Palleronia abyssalis]SPJ26169.1 HTH-type transcriptional repressor RspR [Palleronia abyssalis]